VGKNHDSGYDAVHIFVKITPGSGADERQNATEDTIVKDYFGD
jgi:hypothetical protein